MSDNDLHQFFGTSLARYADYSLSLRLKPHINKLHTQSTIIMDSKKSYYAIYKYDFHVAKVKTLEGQDKDGEKFLQQAETCFASLFDCGGLEKLCHLKNNGDAVFYPNDIMSKCGDFFVWRVNNSQFMELVMRTGHKDHRGKDIYEATKLESNPYCNVIIDNRKGICQMAIEKSKAWNGNPDNLRDILTENFNRRLRDRFDLEISIEAKMTPTEIWDFMHQRIEEYDDYPTRITWSFRNPKKNKGNAMNVKSARLRSMLRSVELSDALKGVFEMYFDETGAKNINSGNKDFAEMISLSANNGYDITIQFKDFKAYRINDYVKAYYPMTNEKIADFSAGTLSIEGENTLEEWFNLILEQTKGYKNESEVPKRRGRSNKVG